MSTSYLSRETFNQNINEIHLKSRLIGDSWSLLEIPSNLPNKNETLIYLEKIEQKLVEQEIYSFTFHVVYSESYSVPVLYLNVSKSNGCLLTHDELYEYFKLAKSSDSSNSIYDLIITQQEHPLLFKPFYFVHPCKTADWMSIISEKKMDEEGEENVKSEDLAVHLDNYTLTWLSFVFSSFKINLDTKYGLKLNDLKDFLQNKI